MAVQVEVDTSELVHLLGRAGIQARSINMSIVAVALAAEIDDILDSEGQKSKRAQKWDPLEGTTVRRHPQRAGGSLLQATGLLANIQTRTAQQTATASSPAPYAGFHVVGTVSMVARDFLDIDDARLLDEIGNDVLMEWQRRF